MSGYGLYVWASFTLTIIFCGLVYLKTLRTLKKYEKEFAKEIDELSVEKKRIVLENSRIASQVLSSYNKSF